MSKYLTRFTRYATRYKNAVRMHGSFVVLVRSLVGWFENWAANVKATTAMVFQDQITSLSINDRAFAIDRLRRPLDSLLSIIERAEGATTRRGPEENRKYDGTAKDRTRALALEASYIPPGVLRDGGPRHDNDDVDIGHIRIVPTYQELLCDDYAYLPANFGGAPHHLPPGSMERIHDIQFRLLREELMFV